MKRIDSTTLLIGASSALLGVIFIVMALFMSNLSNVPSYTDASTGQSTVTSTADNPVTPDVVHTPNSSVTVTSTSPPPERTTSSTVSGEYTFDLKSPLSSQLSDGGLLPGTEILVVRSREGNQVTSESCTIAFSLPTTNGEFVSVTAGHCGSEGREVYSVPTNEYFDSAQKLGVISHVSIPDNDGNSGDWAVIKLNMEAHQPITTAQVPLRIDMTERNDGQWICKDGATTGYACGEKTGSDVRVNLGGFGDTGFSEGVDKVVGIMDQVELCSLPGDSGSPVYDSRGIIGVLSSSSASEVEVSQGFCSESRFSYYSPVEQVLKEIMIKVPGIDIPVQLRY